MIISYSIVEKKDLGAQKNPFIDRVLLSARIELVYEISNNDVCATSKASDQTVHTHSLIRAFASRLSIL